MSDHNSTAAELPSHSSYIRSKRTNNPLTAPKGLPQQPARRWRDLVRYWGPRLGAARLADEAIRATLLNLIWITLELERIRDLPMSQRPAIHSVLHCQQEQRVLLQQLGLNDPRIESGETLEGVEHD